MVTIEACANIPFEDWNRLLSAVRGESVPPAISAASNQLDLAHVIAPQRSNTEGSSSDLTPRHALPQLANSPVDVPVISSRHNLGDETQALQEQNTLLTQTNRAESSQHGNIHHENKPHQFEEVLLENNIRELILEEKINSLSAFRSYLYQTVRKGMVLDPIFRPFSGQIPAEKLEKYVVSFLRIPHTFGPWPYEVRLPRYQSGIYSQRFLVHQIWRNNPIFKEINGIENNNKNKLLLGVWQKMGPPDAGIFQYLGVVQGLDHREMRKYRDTSLAPTVTPLVNFRVLGGSTIKADFAYLGIPASGQERLGEPSLNGPIHDD
ncbi:uncharacterized protein SPSC_01708 [Sporisorium scitamineum]|uniref:Uncharacterized protein n=1 Tax=Sporisorium scitamineum TaxID=49012 RepID=A0A127ZAC0_9BASI|nr:uncharacterized protein SPSC_01708 [Sporisorium scitamineum]